jgi:hypothetical protein
MSNFKTASLTHEVAHRLVSMPGAALMGAGGNVLLRDSAHQSPQELTGAAIGGALGDEVSDRLLSHYMPHLMDLAAKGRPGLLASTGWTGFAAAGLPLLGGYLGSRAGELFKQEQPLYDQGDKTASIEYHGHTFPGYNKPIDNKGGGKHKKVVLAKKGDKVKMIGFGHRDYEHNYSAKAKKNYLKRSAGIKNKSGELTKNDKLSANYWARRVLWPSGPATGAAKKTAHVAGAEQALAVLGIKTATSLGRNSLLEDYVTTGAIRRMLRDVGSKALGGAARGALGGGMAAGEGHRQEGVLRGGALGGVLGGVLGAANLGVMKARGFDPDHVLQDQLTLREIQLASIPEHGNLLRKYMYNESPLAAAHKQLLAVNSLNPLITGGAGVASQWGSEQREQS